MVRTDRRQTGTMSCICCDHRAERYSEAAVVVLEQSRSVRAQSGGDDDIVNSSEEENQS